ncbi:MAG TPA: hypothetical protein IGS52_18455 [Oscillatoriaceae cyanobacterium M33_DOE_052]|nr:hypothetical protein [Oscillatoriaceae cyanobacterium M33_DOE_052]
MVVTPSDVIVLPEQKSISQAYQAFDDHGNLKDPKQQQDVEKLGANLAGILFKLHS